MRSKLLVSAVALGALAVFATGGATGAYWSTAHNAGAGAVSTGTVTLVNGNSTTQSNDYAFVELAGSNMAPGSYAQAPLTIKNAGTTSIDYYLHSWTTSRQLLRDNLALTTTVVPSAAECTTTGSSPSQPGDPMDASANRRLSTQTSEVLCIRLTLSPDAPQELAGAPVDHVTFTFRGSQARNGG